MLRASMSSKILATFSLNSKSSAIASLRHDALARAPRFLEKLPGALLEGIEHVGREGLHALAAAPGELFLVEQRRRLARHGEREPLAMQVREQLQGCEALERGLHRGRVGAAPAEPAADRTAIGGRVASHVHEGIEPGELVAARHRAGP